MKLFGPCLVVLSVTLLALSGIMLIPAILGIILETGNTQAFLRSAMITSGFAVLAWGFGRRQRPAEDLQPRQMFLITAGNWLVLPAFASLPLYLGIEGIGVIDAVFEAVSGITTTGSTVLQGLDDMDADILLWRSQLQWIGGIGIIGMAVAVLPFLKVGGMRLFRTESSEWSGRALLKTQTLFKQMLICYFGLTGLCIAAYRLAGMDLFNAVNHAFTTISTGGYSTSDESFAQFSSLGIHWVAITFMLAGATPFVLYSRVLFARQLRAIDDIQLKGMLVTIGLLATVVLGYLLGDHSQHPGRTVTWAVFNITSVVTTTGYANTDYMQWGAFATAVFLFATFIGGCSGSTSGGVKIFRIQLSLMMIAQQVGRAVHPRKVETRKYNDHVVNEEIFASLVAFLFIMVISLVLMTLILSAAGLDLLTSLSGSATALMNVGPGLGEVIGPAGNFAPLPATAKWVLCLGMIMGRLEFFTIVILFSLTFWKA